MKKCLFSFLSLFFSYAIVAQYTVNTTMNSYQDLTNPISLNQGAVWDESDDYQIYFNFNFEIHGQTFTALNLDAGGGLQFPGLGNKRLYVVHSPFGGYYLKDRGTNSSQSSIGYKIEGTAGNRILKIEWKNAGFKQSATGVNTTDFMNLQVWLYEQTNCIEIHFGANQFSPSTFSQGPTHTLSVKLQYDDCSNILGLQGAANLPSYWFFNSCSPNYSFIDGSPNTGVTYVMCPSTSTNIQRIEEDVKVSVYPTPATNNVIIEDIENAIDFSSFELYDIRGKSIPIDFYASAASKYSMNIKHLTSGVYVLKMRAKEGAIISKKIVKKAF